MNTLLVTENSLVFDGFTNLTSVVFIFFFSSGIEITSQQRDNTLVPVLRLNMDDNHRVAFDGIGNLLLEHGIPNNSNFVYLRDAYCRIP